MIEQNYYSGFTKLCKKNPKIKYIPSIQTLEELGCSISGICYLIDKSERTYNPAIVNPDIFDDDLKSAFEKGIITHTPELKATELPPVEVEKEQSKRFCTECHKAKELTEFRRKPGRGLHYHDVCLECESEPKIPVKEEPKKEEATQIVVKQVHKQKKLIGIERAKELILEAYKIGFKEASEQICISDISLDEILNDRYTEGVANE